MAYRDVILATSGLQSYWRLGEASGTPADETGMVAGIAANNITYAVPGLLAGDADSAYSFNASNATVRFGNVYTFAGTAAFSFEAWIKPSTISNLRRIVDTGYFNSGSDRAGWGVFIANNPSNIRFVRASPTETTTLDSTTVPVIDEVYYIVCSYDGTTMRFYINGAEETSVASAVSMPATSENFRLARRADSSAEWYGGTIDDVAIYDRALTALEVLEHYNAGIGVEPVTEITGSDASAVTAGELATVREAGLLHSASDTSALTVSELASVREAGAQVNATDSGAISLLETAMAADVTLPDPTLLASGTATAGITVTTDFIVDSGLSDGHNQRFVRVTDGAGNQTVVAVSIVMQSETINPQPTLEFIDPASAIAGSEGVLLRVIGSDFVPGSVVRWNDTDLPTSYVSEIELTATVAAALIAEVGSVSVTVFTPEPGGGASIAQPFTITPLPPVSVSASDSSAVALVEATVLNQAAEPPAPPPPPPPPVVVSPDLAVTVPPATFQIRIYHPRNGALLAFVPIWESLSYKRRTIDQGSFELVVHDEHVAAADILLDPVIEIRRNGLVDFTGMSKQPEFDATTERWRLRGPDLKWFLAGRTIVPNAGQEYDSAGGAAESVMRHFVDHQLINTVAVARRINTELDGITFTMDANLGRGPNVSYNGRYINLLTTVTQLARDSGLWFEVVRIDTGYQFRVHATLDASAATGTEPYIFSVARGNVLSQVYQRNRVDLSNTIYVLGQGEGALRTVRQIADADSIAVTFRRETALDSRNNDTTTALDSDGRAFLAAQLASQETAQFAPSPQAVADYRDGWDLGYLVTFAIPDKAISMDQAIVEVSVAVDENGETVTVALGDRPLTIQRVISDALRQTNRVRVV